jgi:ABC-type transport system substrate-binding protein
MKAPRFSIGFIIVIVACLSLAYQMGWAQQPKPGGTLRVASEADITGLDPHVSFGLQAWYVSGSLFNSLVTIDAQLNFVPDLAELWEILDAYSRSFVLDSRGVTQVNHQDPKIDALWDQLKAAPTAEEFNRLSQEVQRYIVGNMVQMSATTLPFVQAARDYVKGYVFERGYKPRFTTTWLDKL